ncbi:MAG TPA: ribose-phosphate pyrophosphokinase [Leucothrix mucor]|uniref:Ribose-phosphate pyrophosphokinase n=1 Tax=Leucothrix mucor TaxID=45248 RepID=A0A7V2SZX3_LEUMU|nr:ribose-phosphate pyrophosphokinase [Leucothrix mucor]
MVSDERMMIFAGNANPQLAQSVADHIGVPLGKATVSQFSDGEIHVEILENVRGSDVFVIQPTCAPTNDNLMELLIMVDALQRASAARITAVIPYFGYARQDRRVRSRRMPISAKLVSDMLSTSHVDRILTIELHSEQIQGFFDLPVDNIYASGVLGADITAQSYENPCVVSPDAGGVVRARELAKALGDIELAIIDKRRPAPNVSAVMHIIGDIKGKTCLIVDDMVDTAGTLCHAANALKEQGAIAVHAYTTHPVLSGTAVNNISTSSLDSLVVTDTIPLNEQARQCIKIRQISVAKILSASIERINREESLSDLFADIKF